MLGSLAALIAEGTAVLKEAGIPESRREALALWAAVAGVSMADAAFAVLESRIEPAEVWDGEGLAVRYHQVLARRAAGEPLAYVTGRVGFRQLDLKIDARCLIPRPETEVLVELALERMSRGVACDVGTGSGCIALSLALEGHFDTVIGLDSSPGALSLARENAESEGLQVAMVQAHLTTSLGPASLDLLVANPPYLTEDEWASLDTSVKDWEPRAALPSGPDGMAATSELLRDGRRVLRPGGWLALEVDSGRAWAVARRAREGGWQAVTVMKDLFGRERYVLARTERSA